MIQAERGVHVVSAYFQTRSRWICWCHAPAKDFGGFLGAAIQHRNGGPASFASAGILSEPGRPRWYVPGYYVYCTCFVVSVSSFYPIGATLNHSNVVKPVRQTQRAIRLAMRKASSEELCLGLLNQVGCGRTFRCICWR